MQRAKFHRSAIKLIISTIKLHKITLTFLAKLSLNTVSVSLLKSILVYGEKQFCYFW